MKYVVEFEYYKNGQITDGARPIICDSFEAANNKAIRLGTAFYRNPVRNTLSLCQAAEVSSITEECLNDSAFDDDGSIDWNDYFCTDVVRGGFSGRMLEDLVIQAYSGLWVLERQDDMIEDDTESALKSLCNLVGEYCGRHNAPIFINGNAESCIDAFNDICIQLNICLKNSDDSLERLRVDYGF